MRVLLADTSDLSVDGFPGRTHPPRKHGGTDDIENLALACAECNLSKGANLTRTDPLSQEITRLFHPREDLWSEHFRWQEWWIKGITDIGRTTFEVLNLNSPARIRVRKFAGHID